MNAKTGHSNDSDISVIIPQYGNWEQTVACCSALWRHHGDGFSIVVVDDGSPAKDREMSKRYLQSNICWVEQPHSGITAAWNLGVRSCRSRLIVLLNNDAVTLTPWLHWSCERLLESPGKLMGAQLRRERLLSQPDNGLLAGWCLCFERATYERVGPFDEAMRLYWSDTDWQLRWKQEFGKDADDFGLIPAGSLRHAGHVSTRRLGERSTRWREDRAMFLKKWGNR